MRKLTLSFLGLLLCLGVQAKADSEHYKLFAGTTMLPTGEQVPIVLKIDTTTGQTWQLVHVPVDGEIHTTATRWLEIDDKALGPAATTLKRNPDKKFDPTRAVLDK